MTAVIETEGFKIVRVCGGFVELYFDWDQLPSLDLSEHYYLVKAVPDSELLPVEYARPNSAGPLYLHLVESVSYEITLLRACHLDYTVESATEPLPSVDLVSQHENLQKLVLGELPLDLAAAENGSRVLEVFADGVHCVSQVVNVDPVIEVRGRPGVIVLRNGDGGELVRLNTNLADVEMVRRMELPIPKSPTKLCFSTVIDPAGGWRVRAELNPSFRMRRFWQRFFDKRFPDVDSSRIVGSFRMLNNDRIVSSVRQFGYWTRVRTSLIDRIQIDEWKLRNRKPVKELKLQLQISSPHRELYRFILLEKLFPLPEELTWVGWDEAELSEAESLLARVSHRVSWDQSHLELVLWFKSDGQWHEFQRDNAHNLRWDFEPGSACESVRCEWVLSNAENSEQSLVVLRSGSEVRPYWPPAVFLQPFNHNRLVALWDLDQKETERAVYSRWQVALKEIGFFLKIHEEYLGNRIHRADLDVHIPELFSNHQSIYFNVEPDKCYSSEIVARHYSSEMALTPVSLPIVTPRLKASQVRCSSYQQPGRWYHPSQREVVQSAGKDSSNKAKVLFHLHMHSPNLFRVDPFREFFLKDVTWPIKTMWGEDVYNTPGEWAVKNCTDAWLPLLRVFRKLAGEQVDFQVSLDISPPAAYMLAHPRFKDYLSRYLLRVQAFVEAQISLVRRRRDSQAYLYAAERYLEDIKALDLFYNQELGKDVIGAFCDLERRGFLEISTCTATHGMPAELANMRDTLKSQVTLAARSHHRLFGERPHGIWLAENSFFPGVEEVLACEWLKYLFVESESVLLGSSCPVEEEFNPVVIPGSNVTAFPRSRLGRTQVWDAEIGYAGHPDFREYHFRHLGLPVKKITSKTSNDKAPYDPDRADQTAKELAWDFHHKLSEKAYECRTREFKTIPLITCSYDAELFGHHWSEGPVFLEELLREFDRRSDAIGLTTPSHYLVDASSLPSIMPNPSTWGHETVHVRWSDPKVVWTYREIHRAEGVLNRYLGYALEGKLEEWQKAMVEQMAAELIRAQSSDLTFVIMAGDFEEDMRREILKYLNYFYRFKHLIDNLIENQEFLAFRRYENDMFPEIPAYYGIR